MHIVNRSDGVVPHERCDGYHDQTEHGEWFLVRVPKGLHRVVFETKLEGEAFFLYNVIPGMDRVEVIALSQAKQSKHYRPVREECADVKKVMERLKMGAPSVTNKSVESLDQHLRLLGSSHEDQSKAGQVAEGKFTKLTVREWDVLKYVVAGKPNKIIAADLGISQRTVENHRASVMRKTSSKSLPELVRSALFAGVQND